jgi:hypothetical protein
VRGQMPEGLGSVSDKIPWYLKEEPKVDRPRRANRGFGHPSASFKPRSQRFLKDLVDEITPLASKAKEES